MAHRNTDVPVLWLMHMCTQAHICLLVYKPSAHTEIYLCLGLFKCTRLLSLLLSFFSVLLLSVLNTNTLSSGGEWHGLEIRLLSDLHRGRLHSQRHGAFFLLSAPSTLLPAALLSLFLSFIIVDPLQAYWSRDILVS